MDFEAIVDGESNGAPNKGGMFPADAPDENVRGRGEVDCDGVGVEKIPQLFAKSEHVTGGETDPMATTVGVEAADQGPK